MQRLRHRESNKGLYVLALGITFAVLALSCSKPMLQADAFQGKADQVGNSR